MANKLKVLIAGSGGFIGSNLIRHILKSSNNYTVVGIDRCDHPNVLNTIYSNKGAEFHIADATDEHILKTIFTLEQPDIVIYAINSSNKTTSINSASNLINNAKDHKAKLILLSDYEVYEDERNTKEECACDLSHYRSLEVMVENSGVDYNIARLSNNIGPRQYCGMVPETIRILLENNTGTLDYNGSHIRSYIHVQDTCSALLKMMDGWKNNEIYNISTKQELSYIEVLQEICNTMNVRHDLVKLNSNMSGRPILTADNSKIKSLGWNSSWKFKDSISQCCTWYKNNSWFLKG